MSYTIIDTSSMLFAFSYKKNLFDIAKYAFPGNKQLVSKGIINELTRISHNKGSKGTYAKIALLELKSKKVSVDNITGNADAWILNKARASKDIVVITNDSALARSLLSEGAKVFKIAKSGILRRFSR